MLKFKWKMMTLHRFSTFVVGYVAKSTWLIASLHVATSLVIYHFFFLKMGLHSDITYK
jgi:hypothetical protein